MRLQEIYTGDELDMNQFDLERAAELIDYWLAGGEIDPHMAHYAGMVLLSLSQRAPELPDEQ